MNFNKQFPIYLLSDQKRKYPLVKLTSVYDENLQGNNC